jgi:hypothetical protein
MEGFNATEVLQEILDEARVPLIRRTIHCADETIAAAEVSGEDSKAKIVVMTHENPIRVRIYSCGSEFVGVAEDPRLIVEDAADFINRWVEWKLITLKDIFGEIEDEVEDDTRELMRS